MSFPGKWRCHVVSFQPTSIRMSVAPLYGAMNHRIGRPWQAENGECLESSLKIVLRFQGFRSVVESLKVNQGFCHSLPATSKFPSLGRKHRNFKRYMIHSMPLDVHTWFIYRSSFVKILKLQLWLWYQRTCKVQLYSSDPLQNQFNKHNPEKWTKKQTCYWIDDAFTVVCCMFMQVLTSKCFSCCFGPNILAWKFCRPSLRPSGRETKPASFSFTFQTENQEGNNIDQFAQEISGILPS